MSTSSTHPTNPSDHPSPYQDGAQPVYDQRDVADNRVAPSGPNVPAVVLGALAVLLAVAVALAQWGWYTVDLEASGPWIIVGAGAVLLAAGIFSLVRGSTRR